MSKRTNHKLNDIKASKCNDDWRLELVESSLVKGYCKGGPESDTSSLITLKNCKKANAKGIECMQYGC
jgi:hypothetical protein